MSHSTVETNKDTSDVSARLATLRDEIRVRVHLAGMEAKQGWEVLEKEYNKVEGSVKAATVAPRADLKALEERFKSFLTNLGGKAN